MFFVETNAPASYVDALIVSQDIYSESENTLKQLGIEIFYSFNNGNVAQPLSKHTDMQLVHMGAKKYICAPECYEHYKAFFEYKKAELIAGNTYLSSNYPADIAYNIIVTGKYAVHNFKHTDSVLKKNISKSVQQINVSQGYSRCSVCCVADKGFITSDRGVYEKLLNSGCNVLLIQSGKVDLPGYDIGFIGGASFMIAPNVLAINGNIDYHPDSEQIKLFCKENGVNILSLSDNPIMDIGSAVAFFSAD